MRLEIIGLEGIGEARRGDSIGALIVEACARQSITLCPADILVVAHKIVSKAEGQIVRLDTVEPSARAVELAQELNKDARLVEIILRESRRVIRKGGTALIVETHHGFICANAGVDRSNVEGADIVTLLPKDPDRSARELAESLGCGIIVSDTFGRVWREGLVDTAIGIARVPPFIDFRGKADTHGYQLQATLLASADALAAAAGLVMGKTSRTPAALIRGFPWEEANTSAAALLRAPEKDLFL